MHRDRRCYAWAWLQGSTRYSAQTKAWLSLTSVLWLGSLGAQSSPAATGELPMPDWLPDSATPVQPDEAELDLTIPATDPIPVAPVFAPTVQFSTPVSPPPTAVEALPSLMEAEAIAPPSHEFSEGEATVPPEPTPVTTVAPLEVEAIAPVNPQAPDSATTARPPEAIAPATDSLTPATPQAEVPAASSDPASELTQFSPPRVWEPGTMPQDDWEDAAELASEPRSLQLAQLTVPDNTLGAESSVVNFVEPPNGQDFYRIEGGATRGSNLFHSFERFGVGFFGVYFANPVNIENIFARVTGGESSFISGTLGVEGPANLFLLNPNGITFDSGARLDISGSFTASTGSRFTFADGGEFNAAPVPGGDLLTLSVPLGVQFNDNNGPFNGDIINFARPILSAGQDLTLLGNTLDLFEQSSAGNNLTLVGNTLSLSGSLNAGNNLTLGATETVTFNGTETKPFAANATNDLTIQGNQGITVFTVQSAPVPLVSGGDMTLISDGAIAADTTFFDSGGNLQFLRLDGTPANLTDFNAPVIAAIGDIIFGDYRGTALKVIATGSIQAGDIEIVGPNTRFVADGSGSDEDLLASSQAVILRAGVPQVDNPNVPQVAGGTTFDNGTITNPFSGVLLPPGSILFDSIDTSNFTGGDGGPIILEAAGSITGFYLDSYSRTVTGNSGNGGNISLSAGRGVTGQGDIILNRPVRSGSQSFGGNAGNGGAVSFSTRAGDIQLNNAGVFSGSASDDFQGGSAQAGGAISFSTTSGNIRLTNSPLSSESDAFDAGPQANTGPAGNVSLTTSTGNITLENSAIFAMNDAPNQSSPGGTVTIASTDGGDITLNNLSRIWSYSASRLGQAGDGGAVRLSTTTGNIRLSDRSFIDTASRSSESDAGNGGAISLSTTTGNIMLSGNSSLDSRASAFSFDAARNAGHGGNISITSESGDITIMDNASIDSQTSTNFAGGEFGEGGDITISSPAGTVTLGSGINLNSNAAGGEGNGGDIRVAGTTVQLTNNELSTTVGGSGTAGDITINASNQARITSSRLLSGRLASAEGSGGGGTIRITAADIELRDFSFLNTATFGFGDAGDVQLVTTQGDIVLIDSSIFSLAAQQGNPGNIRLDSAGQLRLEGNSLVSTAVALGVPNTSSSRSGNITINAANGVEIIGTGAINQPVQVSTNPNLVSINSTDRSTPQPLDEAFALLPNVQTAPNVLFPQDIPFVSVNSSSSISCCSTRHYYSIDIESVGTQIILDVDTPKTKIFGASEVIDELNLLDVDLSLQRFDGIGNFDTLIFTPVAENASAPTTLGAGGSTTSDDAYLTYIFDRPGTYVIEVISEFSNPFFSPFAEIDYTLNVSLVDDSLVSSGISTQTRSGIPSGDITINTPSITLQNGGEISAETLRDGPAGDITLQPFGSGQTLDIQLGDRSTISSSTLPSRAGTDGSLVTGNSGRISLSAPAALNLSGPGSIQVETNTAGDAGAIALTAPQITLNGIEVSASTEFPEGLTAAQQAALIANRTAGRGGDIDIRTSLLTLNNGSQIRAATASTATGGNLTVTGNSPLTIGGDGRLTVEATGANSGQAGNLNVRASELLRLRDGIELSANSESRQGGGNINIDVENGSLVMRGGSYINATSSNPNAGDGGNVTLTLSDGFLIALPGQNNDIIANAVRGRGGNINISALRLFGFTLQDDANVSRLRGNNTNDISASSEIGLPGDIAIDTLALDPSQGLTELPLNLEDRADQVTPGCGLGNTDDGSEFVVTGRGGLPPGASDPLMANGVSVPWVTATEGESTIAIAPTNSPVTNAVLIEAQGVALDAAGQPYLAATAEDWAIYQAGLPTATTCTVQPTRSH